MGGVDPPGPAVPRVLGAGLGGRDLGGERAEAVAADAASATGQCLVPFPGVLDICAGAGRSGEWGAGVGGCAVRVFGGRRAPLICQCLWVAQYCRFGALWDFANRPVVVM